MKKELFAAALLLVILALSILNSAYVGRVTDELCALIDRAAEAVSSGDREGAAEKAAEARGLWEAHSGYLRAIINHEELSAVENDLYELRSRIAEGGTETAVLAAEHARDGLRAIAYTEGLHLGSIF